MTRHCVLAGAFSLVAAWAVPVFAASLDIAPGLWEITSSRSNPMTGQPIQETERHCIRENTFDPRDSMMEDGMENCSIADENLAGNTLTYTIQCADPSGMTMTGNMRYTVNDTDMDGDMNMTMSGPMTMTMTYNWSGKRVGDC